MKELYYHLTMKSSNRKTGPIAVLTSSFYTCPDTCPFKNNGCYGNGGPLLVHWNKLTKGNRGVTLTKLLTMLRELGNKELIRLFQVGDLPGYNKHINVTNTKRLIKALRDWRAFGYTHKPLYFRKNAEIIKHCNDEGICINLSANNLVDADKLLSMKVGPVTVTLPKNTSLKRKSIKTSIGKVVICPATINNDITCSVCGGKKGPLCYRINRNFTIGFPAHGSGANKVSEIASYGFK